MALHCAAGLFRGSTWYTFDRVGVAAVPEKYEERLIEMFPRVYRHLRLMALDPYDPALSKLERNGQKDRDDVRFLARSVPLDPEVLKHRYATEFRWQLGWPEGEDLTLRLWIEMMLEDKDCNTDTITT